MTGVGVFVGLLFAGLVGDMFADRRLAKATSDNSRGTLPALVVLIVVLAAACSKEAAAPSTVDSSASSTTSTERTTTTAKQATTAPTEPETICDPARCPEWEQAVQSLQAKNPLSRSQAECMINVFAEHSDLRDVVERGDAVFGEMSETEQNAVALDALDRCPEAMQILLGDAP
jgi:hypothetical protein